MNKYCLTFVVLLWAATTWADCDKTTTDYDVVYCGTKIYLQADKELNDAYQKLVGKLIHRRQKTPQDRAARLDRDTQPTVC
jgi:uncharacterized protein YecT (DUF1311 family)